MTVTAASFKASFPEFDQADNALVEAKLADASLQVDPDVWGVETDHGTKYLAAHLLAMSPYSQFARLVAKDGTTYYQEQYLRLQRQMAAGYRVI